MAEQHATSTRNGDEGTVKTELIPNKINNWH